MKTCSHTRPFVDKIEEYIRYINNRDLAAKMQHSVESKQNTFFTKVQAKQHIIYENKI